MEKYGFVYIWYDRKHKRFYIGCHWGKEDDGYVCSSPWMIQAYKRRPEDFKRRILATSIESRAKLFEEEFRWLSMIKDCEIRHKYYNLNISSNHWSIEDGQRKTIGEKISKTLKALFTNGAIVATNSGKTFSNEYRQKLSDSHKGLPSPRKGTRLSSITKKKISNSKRGSVPWNVGVNHTEETKKLISQTTKSAMNAFICNNPPKTCSYCGNTFSIIGYNRWHGDRCKAKYLT